MGRLHRPLFSNRRWLAVRRAVFNRDGWRCRACGAPGRLECDHIVPLHVDPLQDPFDIDGCQSLCFSCHIGKTREENRRALTPAELRWRSLVDAMRLQV